MNLLRFMNAGGKSDRTLSIPQTWDGNTPCVVTEIVYFTSLSERKCDVSDKGPMS